MSLTDKFLFHVSLGDISGFELILRIGERLFWITFARSNLNFELQLYLGADK